MTGIVFPNLIGTLAPLMALEQADKRLEFDAARAKRADEADARKKAAGVYVPAALAGDKDAYGKLAIEDADTAVKLFPMLQHADTQQRAKVKEAADWTSKAAMGVLSLPPEQRAQAYQAALEDGRARGYDLSKMPAQYTPDVEGRLNFYASQARDVNKWFEEQGNRPTPMGGAPGGAATAIAGIESGGRYDAIGPVANAQGNRAYGKYQVLDSNIGPWTQEVLGKAMTPQEFLANQQAQDAVFNAKFGQYVKQYGTPEAASRAWFAGPGGMNNPGAKDVNGMTVAGYSQRFQQGMGGPVQGDAAPPADGSGTPVPPAGDGMDQFRAMKLPPGARFMAVKGQPIVKDGAAYIMLGDGTTTWAPLPQRAEPQPRIPAGFRQTADGNLEFIPGGPADPSIAKRASPMNNEQARDAGFADRMQNSNAILSQYETQGTKFWERMAEKLQDKSGTAYGMSKEFQEFRQAKDDFINAQLRRESGAAIGVDEYRKADRQYFPQPGDSKEVIAQKAKNRQLAVEGMIRGGGPSYTPSPTVNKPASQPAPAAPPATPAAPQAPQGVTEGATATNPQTGERVIFRGGQWTPLNSLKLPPR